MQEAVGGHLEKDKPHDLEELAVAGMAAQLQLRALQILAVAVEVAEEMAKLLEKKVALV